MVDRAVWPIAWLLNPCNASKSNPASGRTRPAALSARARNAACLEMWCGAAMAAQEATGKEDPLTVQAFLMAVRGPYRETVEDCRGVRERDNPDKVMKE